MMHLQHLHLIFVEDERVDWNMSAQAIHNHIRGLSPWPVAYTTMNEKNLKLFSFHCEREKGNPGTIIETTKHELIIATGSDDAIALTEIQPAGKTYESY